MATAILSVPHPSVEGQLVRLHVAAKLVGVSTSTLRRLTNTGDLDCVRTPVGNHRLVSAERVCEMFGFELPGNDEENESAGADEGRLSIGYARSSTSKMVKDGMLAAQAKRVEAYIVANGDGGKHQMIAEQGSGTNCERRGLNKIIDLALSGRLARLYIENEDRLSRGNYVLIVKLLEKCGVEIVLTRTGEKETAAQTDDEEILFDCMNLLFCLQAKRYGKRSQDKIRTVASPETKTRIGVLIANGLGRRAIASIIVAEQHRCLNTGKIFTEAGVRNVMRDLRQGGLPLPESIQRFLDEKCILRPGKITPTGDVWSAYQAFAEQERLPCPSRQKLMGLLRDGVKSLTFEDDHLQNYRIVGLSLRS